MAETSPSPYTGIFNEFTLIIISVKIKSMRIYRENGNPEMKSAKGIASSLPTRKYAAIFCSNIVPLIEEGEAVLVGLFKSRKKFTHTSRNDMFEFTTLSLNSINYYINPCKRPKVSGKIRQNVTEKKKKKSRKKE